MGLVNSISLQTQLIGVANRVCAPYASARHRLQKNRIGFLLTSATWT